MSRAGYGCPCGARRRMRNRVRLCALPLWLPAFASLVTCHSNLTPKRTHPPRLRYLSNGPVR
jgi:hypothetical protein